MTGCVLIAAAVLGADLTSTPEADYLLRVEVIGYVDAPLTDVPPQEAFLRSVELLCRPGHRFRAQLTAGKETTTVSGKLESQESGEFAVDLLCSHVVDTGRTVPIAPGKTQKILDITSSHATVTLTPGKPFRIGGIVTKTHDQHDKLSSRASKKIVIVTIAKDQPSES